MTEAAQRKPAPGLEIDVSVPCQRWREALPRAAALCRDAATAAFQTVRAGVAGAEVSIVLADDGFIQGLNRDYRDHDEPTNVLSFPVLSEAEETPPHRDVPRMLGDIVVAFETADAEAEAQGKTLGDHLSHLVVHGMFHLLGHDHRTKARAEAMEKLEIEVLGGLGIANPYVDGGPVRADK